MRRDHRSLMGQMHGRAPSEDLTRPHTAISLWTGGPKEASAGNHVHAHVVVVVVVVVVSAHSRKAGWVRVQVRGSM